MTFTDPNLIHEPAARRPVPAAWGGTVRDDLEFLVEPPACRVAAAEAQLVSSQGFGEPIGDVINAPDKLLDTFAMHNPEQDNSRIHAPAPGRYLATGAVFFQTNPPAGYRVVLDFLVNGTQVVNGDARFFAAATPFHGVQALRTLTLAVGDYVELMVQHNAGQEREVRLMEFALVWVGVTL